MAISEQREVVIEATPEEILDVLLDIEHLTEWSSAHQEVEVLERDDRGHPKRSRMVVKVVGITDEQFMDHSTYPDGVGWTLLSAKQQRAQDARYTLTPEGDTTRVRFDLTVELTAPLPGFLVRKGAKGLLDTATEGLRQRVLKVKSS
jgi:ribosome-associated toxin RatA of RatAB toxin-antitoxin module